MNLEPPIVAPSILASDFSQLGDQIKTCIEAGTQWIHCDIMDGHFVPNISFGPLIVEVAAKSGDVFTDVHLMIENPDQYVEPLAEAGANLLTVHQEVCPHLHRTVQHIKQHNMKAGVAVNPATSLHQLIPILPYIDLVLIMSVNPGFGGQSFIESSYKRIKEIYSMREKYDLHFLIEVDGGINPANIQNIAKAGADVFVTGSSVFKSSDISKQIHILTEKATQADNMYI